jgi:hypothetical protein
VLAATVNCDIDHTFPDGVLTGNGGGRCRPHGSITDGAAAEQRARVREPRPRASALP